MPVRPGDHVVFPASAGVWVEVEEERLLVCRVGQLLGVLEELEEPRRGPAACGRGGGFVAVGAQQRRIRSSASSTIGDAERHARQVLAVAQRQPVQAGLAERLQVAAQHLDKRLRTVGARSGAALVLRDDEASRGAQLARLAQLGEQPVDPVGLLTDLLEQQQATLRVELPRRPQRRAEDRGRAARERGAHPPRHDRDRRGRGSVDGVGAAAERRPEGGGRVLARAPMRHQHRAPQARRSGRRQRDQQMGDVGHADQRLAARGDPLEVDQRQQLTGAVSTAHAHHGVHRLVCERCLELGGALLCAPCEMAVAAVRRR